MQGPPFHEFYPHLMDEFIRGIHDPVIPEFPEFDPFVSGNRLFLLQPFGMMNKNSRTYPMNLFQVPYNVMTYHGLRKFMMERFGIDIGMEVVT